MTSYFSLAAMQLRHNISELKSHLRQAPESNKAKINEVIKLYEDRKIQIIKTALTTVASLASTYKSTINSGKPYCCITNSLISMVRHYQ